MSGLPDIQVDLAAPEERVALENMLQLYIHDFSEFWFDRPEGELEADGRFADYPLDTLWERPDYVPLLLRRDGRLIGFALLNTHSHAGAPLDRSVAEFFIVRKHRRGGVGTAAAQAIFRRYPGRWEAAVARRNVAALAFWRRAVATCPGVADIEELDIISEDWNGPVLLFRVES